MKGPSTPDVPAEFPEPFSAVPVVLEDGRRTWAVWTGWQWWGEHRPLQVLAWAKVTDLETTPGKGVAA